MESLTPLAQAGNDIERALAAIDLASLDELASTIVSAKRIVAFGMGREGLMLRAAVMRWMHLGLDAHFAGDVTAPPVGPGDLLIVSDGTGTHQMHATMVRLGNEQQAATLVMTANPDAPTSALAGQRFVIPARTMAGSDTEVDSILSMGSLYEAVLLIATDVLALRIQALKGVTNEAMEARHTNLE